MRVFSQMNYRVGTLNRKTGLPWTLEEARADARVRAKKAFLNNIEKYNERARLRSKLDRLNNPEKCREAVRKHYEKKVDYYRSRSKHKRKLALLRPNRLEQMRKLSSKHRRIHPDKVNCRNRTKYYIDNGHLIRPKVCPSCSLETFVQAHHEDYSKPIQVKWLCRACHMLEHRKYR